MLTRDRFITIVRDELKLPLTDPDLEQAFDQPIRWRSVQRVRLYAALEKETGRRIPVGRLFEEQTVAGVYQLFVATDTTAKESET
ncbi:acyl carrier protein [Solwaraspora sp. WMMA2101]|uniref:acyl carrier protein n=1 Tax=Solwaraspora sp. WMMA2101 TaxID=3404124 RepID=UPI003B945584